MPVQFVPVCRFMQVRRFVSVRFVLVRFLRSSTFEYDFEILDGSESRPGPNSEEILEIGSEWAQEVMQNLGNPYQMEDNKAAPSAPPEGGGVSRRPLGFCCLPFGKDFLSFVSFLVPILDRFSEFVTNLVLGAIRTHPTFQNRNTRFFHRLS